MQILTQGGGFITVRSERSERGLLSTFWIMKNLMENLMIKNN